MTESINIATGLGDAIRGQIIREGDGELKAPENIINTESAARAIYYKYRSDHIKRIQLYANIEGLIAGNPPYNPSELAKHNLSYISNFNSLDGRALFERGALAYWNLFNQAETICKITVNGFPDQPEILEINGTLSREWSKVVRQWKSFNTLMNMHTSQIVKFGISPILWPDEQDWRWRVIELSKFYVQDQAQSDIAQLTSVCVESIFTAQYLFEVYEHCKKLDKDKSPWNCDALAKLLLYIANTNVKTTGEFTDFMELQRRLQNGDFAYDALFSDGIRLITLLYQEYDEKISVYYFHRTFEAGDFLYFADRLYDHIYEAINIFTASPGEFTIHSNRGLGHKIFSICQANMQLDCSIVDMARWASTLLVKSQSTGSKDAAALRLYPGTPTDIGTADFVQNTLGANISQLIGASQYMTQKVQFNTANSGDDPSQPDRNIGSVAPSQARAQSYKEFGVLKNNIAHFYSQLDTTFENMLVKMLKCKQGHPGYEFVKTWKDNCIAQGVPEEIFKVSSDEYALGMPKRFSIKATRVAGDGSNLAWIMGLQELAPLMGDFGPKESAEYKRQWIMATLGTEYVAAFTADSVTPDEMAGGASLAGLENNSMQNGQSPVFSPDNEQRAHFVTHSALAQHTIQALQQQQTNPVDADKIFSVLVPHMGEHFQQLTRSPFTQKFAKGVENSFKQIEAYAKLNRNNAAQMYKAQIKKQQQEQEATQQTMSDAQRKDFTAQADAKRDDFKVQNQVERAQEASATRAKIGEQTAKDKASNERLAITLKHSAGNDSNGDLSGGGSRDPSANPLEGKPLTQLRTELTNLNGRTPAPSDIEPPLDPFNGA